VTQSWLQLPDLASRRVGGSVVGSNDEFFAEQENLIKPDAPVFRPLTFTNKGQEYDGWETRRRRRRDPGDHDWVITRLGIPGVVRGITVDTSFFKGNYPPEISVDGVWFDPHPTPADLEAAPWFELVPRSPVTGHTANRFDVTAARRCSHVRLRIHPDGGVARLRVHGVAVADPRWLDVLPFDLAALANGAVVTDCSDWFFSPPNNMLQPGQSLFMADGWESARRRDTGYDWAEIRLAAECLPRVLELDTTHYKGNAPEHITLHGRSDHGEATAADPGWFPLLPETHLEPDATHRFRLTPDDPDRPVTHLRLTSHPDGGIARLRVHGPLTDHGRTHLHQRWHATT
jgi:allantoicase